MLINHKLTRYLSQYNINVPIAVISSGERPYVYVDSNYYMITKYVEGEVLDELHIMDNVSQYGVILAKLHIALKDFNPISDCSTMNILYDIYNWSYLSIENEGLYNLNKVKELFNEDFNKKISSLDTQYIHRDFHAGNVLFIDNELSGIIDFDLTIKGLRIFDVCYFLTSRLARMYNDKDTLAKWLGLIKPYIDAYANINRLTHIEKELIPKVMVAIELIFAAWFISIDDSENTKYTYKLIDYLVSIQKNIYSEISCI